MEMSSLKEVLNLPSRELMNFPIAEENAEDDRVYTSVKKIYLYDNFITSIPETIGNFNALQVLSLSSNRITSIPVGIGKLTSLKELYLNNNSIYGIPTELGSLVNILRLNISNNYITSIPSELGNLINMKEFLVSSNSLTSLPNELGNLMSLELLEANNNRLTTIPDELGNLSLLKELILSNNDIERLPIALGQLHALEVLSLFNNQLSSIPKELGNMKNLHTLYLNSNILMSIPPELGQVTTLKILHLQGNPLMHLPPELGTLGNLQRLYIDQELLEYIPPQVRRFLYRERVVAGIYTDTQSIHNSGIQQSFRKSVNRLTNRKPLLELEQSLKELLTSPIQEKTKNLMLDYCSNTDVHSELHITYGELFVSIWDRIRSHQYKRDLIKRLEEELEDSISVCFTGRITRLVNTLSGYDPDVELYISDNEQLSQLTILTREKIFPYQVEAHKSLFEKEALERGYSLDVIRGWSAFLV